jgi:hypothetical protein
MSAPESQKHSASLPRKPALQIAMACGARRFGGIQADVDKPWRCLQQGPEKVFHFQFAGLSRDAQPLL